MNIVLTFAVLAVIAVALFFLTRTPTPNVTPKLTAHVRHVIDGDTFALHGTKERIRIFGIDAPEMDDTGGQAAKAHLSNMIAGQRLQCQIVTQDKYGRHVARCTLPNGHDVGLQMIESGHANEFCRYSKNFYGRC